VIEVASGWPPALRQLDGILGRGGYEGSIRTTSSRTSAAARREHVFEIIRRTVGTSNSAQIIALAHSPWGSGPVYLNEAVEMTLVGILECDDVGVPTSAVKHHRQLA